MTRPRTNLRRGTRCHFKPKRLKTVCRKLEPNHVDGEVTGEYSIRDFESGIFRREEKDGFGNLVLVFRGENVGKVDRSRWYEFSVTLYKSNPNQEVGRRNKKTVFAIIPQTTAKK